MTKKKESVQRNYTENEIIAHALKVGGRRNLREIIVEDDDGGKTAYLVRKPSRALMQAITAAGEKRDVTKSANLLIGCVLEGDMELLDSDGSVFVELTGRIAELAQQSKSEVKKL